MRKISIMVTVLFLFMAISPVGAWAKVITGSKTWSNGCKYAGQLNNGKAEGKGTITYPNGRKINGKWKNDKLNGPGTLIEPNGTKYSGLWRNNNLVGKLKKVSVTTNNSPPAKIAKTPVPTITPANELSEQQKWALATADIYTDYNNLTHDVLGGESSRDIQALKDSLVMYWEIDDTKSARESLVWLKDVGHRSEFNTMATITDLLDDQQIEEFLKQNPVKGKQLKMILEYKNKLAGKSLLAWDYCRLVNLAGQCYSAGYISEEEAWQYIMPAAQALQKNYSSWEDMANNFLLGREFWCGTKDPGMQAVVKNLLSNPESPWKRYLWNMPLK